MRRRSVKGLVTGTQATRVEQEYGVGVGRDSRLRRTLAGKKEESGRNRTPIGESARYQEESRSSTDEPEYSPTSSI